MIKSEKLPSALYALQKVLVRGRQMAYECARTGDCIKASELADLLDRAEYLPFLIASETDETNNFRANLEAIAKKHDCAYVLSEFDSIAPPSWRADKPGK